MIRVERSRPWRNAVSRASCDHARRLGMGHPQCTPAIVTMRPSSSGTSTQLRPVGDPGRNRASHDWRLTTGILRVAITAPSPSKTKRPVRCASSCASSGPDSRRIATSGRSLAIHAAIHAGSECAPQVLYSMTLNVCSPGDRRTGGRRRERSVHIKTTEENAATADRAMPAARIHRSPMRKMEAAKQNSPPTSQTGAK